MGKDKSRKKLGEKKKNLLFVRAIVCASEIAIFGISATHSDGTGVRQFYFCMRWYVLNNVVNVSGTAIFVILQTHSARAGARHIYIVSTLTICTLTINTIISFISITIVTIIFTIIFFVSIILTQCINSFLILNAINYFIQSINDLIHTENLRVQILQVYIY